MFCILITLDFTNVKPYGNIVNLYAIFFIKSTFYLTIFSLHLGGISSSLVWTIISELC